MVSREIRRQIVEVEKIVNGRGEEIGVFCLGHVDKRGFVARARREVGDTTIRLEDAKHLHFRKVPTPRHGEGQKTVYYESEGGKQGSFPVTALWLW